MPDTDPVDDPAPGEDPAPVDDPARRDSLLLRVWGVVRNVFLTTAAVLGAVSILMFAAMLVFGLRPEIVISGSMEPTIPTGSMSFARVVDAKTVKVGDIVTVNRTFGTGLVTHRVVKTAQGVQGVTLLTLRGDANKTDDPQPYSVREAGLVAFSVPVLGTVASAFQSKNGLVAIALVALAFISAFVFDPARIRRWFAAPAERVAPAARRRA